MQVEADGGLVLDVDVGLRARGGGPAVDQQGHSRLVLRLQGTARAMKHGARKRNDYGGRGEGGLSVRAGQWSRGGVTSSERDS